MFSKRRNLPNILLIKEPTTQEELNFLPDKDMLLWGTPFYDDALSIEDYESQEKQFVLDMSHLLTHAYKSKVISLIPVEPDPGYYFIHLRDHMAYRHLIDHYIEEDKHHYAKATIGRY